MLLDHGRDSGLSELAEEEAEVEDDEQEYEDDN